MPTYCLKCKKNTESINSIVLKLWMLDHFCHQNFLYVEVEIQNL